MDEAQKVSNASFSLKDIALVWWRRRCDDVKRGSAPITTWDEFKKELKKQFYPKDAEYEARAKLRRLQHEDGRIREYVKEFQELLLEIPNMGEQDALFCFLDGLRGWARMELERRGVQDLASAIAAAESLIELKRDSSKGRNKKAPEDSDSEEDRDHSPKKHRPPLQHKSNGKKEEAPKKYTCFLCNGPHRVYECPKRGKLAALVMDEERQEEEGRIASMSLLSAIQTKVGEQAGGRMYVETEVGGKKLQATVDTGADTVYMAKELADEIHPSV